MSAEAERNREIVMDFFKQSETGGDAFQYVSPDLQWWVPGYWRLGGTYSLADLPAVMGQVYAMLDGIPTFTFNSVIAEDNRVAVDCESSGKLRNGEPFGNTYHFLFTLEDGKIVKVKEFLNTHYMQTLLDRFVPEPA